VRYEIRPLGNWADKETSPRRGAHIFKASWSSTLTLLSDELRLLEAAEPVVFQVDVREGDIRLDGMRSEDEIEGHELPPGALYRKLARRMHPDTPTGSSAEWDRLDTARQLLTTAGLL
jgi:hypothetical protein